MLSEDLFVSMKEIKVRYHFLNQSDKAVVTQIAFPMPDIPYGVDDFNFAIPTDDPQNILGFTTAVDGRPVVASVEQKAFLGGVDRTDDLRRLGIPIAPGPSQKLDYVSQQTWNDLIQLRLIQDAPKGDLQPRWTLKTTYYWQQVFPPHQEVVIDHRYLPSVGSVVPMSASDLIRQPLNLQIDQSRGLNRYCIDKSFLAAIAKPANTMWEQHSLQYILATGANWSGPIKNFRLVVDKESPDNLVSFCAQGVKKIAPTQFEISVSQFVPTSNLDILILSPSRSEPDNTPVVSSDARKDIVSLNCDQLWYQRNAITKAAGYCFRTPRAIRVFGNAGCKYDSASDLPLSDRDRQSINSIQQVERVKSCRQ